MRINLFRSTSEPISNHSMFRRGSYDRAIHGYIRPNSGRNANRRNVLVTLIRRIRPESLRISINSLNRNSVRTFYCKICMSNCASALSFCAGNCSHKHEYCIPCMNGYITAQVLDGVIHYPCPGVAECGEGKLNMDELQLLLSEEMFTKLERLIQVKTNIFYRECPQCAAEYTTSDSQIRANGPEITCSSCLFKYCFYHANAHPNKNCEEYARTMSLRVKADLEASEALVVKYSKLCPQCKSATEKSGGCNHMYVCMLIQLLLLLLLCSVLE